MEGRVLFALKGLVGCILGLKRAIAIFLVLGFWKQSFSNFLFRTNSCYNLPPTVEPVENTKQAMHLHIHVHISGKKEIHN